MDKYLAGRISEIYVLSHTENGRVPVDSETYSSKIRVYRLFNSSDALRKHFAFIRIFDAIRAIRPDVVHFQYSPLPKGKYGGFIGEPLLLLFLLLRLIHIPFFVTLHSIWLPEQAKARLFELTNSKMLSHFAWHYFKINTYFLGKMPKKLSLLVARRDPSIIETFSRAYQIPHARLREELHGIWWRDGKVDSGGSNLVKGSQKIVCLGVIRPSKGYEIILKAMRTVIKKLPGSSLVIAGTTISSEGKSYLATLRSLVKEYSLDNSVKIEERYLSEGEFSEYIRTAGVVVLPYTRVVGASSILSISLSYRIPVILADSGPFFEKLSDIMPVVPSFDDKALADEIIKVLDSEEYKAALIERYGEYAASHDWSVLVKNTYSEFSDVLR